MHETWAPFSYLRVSAQQAHGTAPSLHSRSRARHGILLWIFRLWLGKRITEFCLRPLGAVSRPWDLQNRSDKPTATAAAVTTARARAPCSGSSSCPRSASFSPPPPCIPPPSTLSLPSSSFPPRACCSPSSRARRRPPCGRCPRRLPRPPGPLAFFRRPRSSGHRRPRSSGQ